MKLPYIDTSIPDHQPSPKVAELQIMIQQLDRADFEFLIIMLYMTHRRRYGVHLDRVGREDDGK